MLARSKLNSIESKISEALIRMMESQRSDNKKINLIEEGKKNRY